MTEFDVTRQDSTGPLRSIERNTLAGHAEELRRACRALWIEVVLALRLHRFVAWLDRRLS